MDGDIFTLSEAARYLDMSYGSARDKVSTEKLGRTTVGGIILLTREEVERMRALKRRPGRPAKPSTQKGAKV